MNNKILDFYGTRKSCGTTPLAVIANLVKEHTTYSCIVELTFNYPHTASFKRMTEAEQQALYKQLFEKVYDSTPSTVDYSYHFEKCKSGYTHLHGWISIKSNQPYYIQGLIMDIVKRYFAQLTPRYSQWRLDQYHDLFGRYRSPMICAQYTPVDDTDRASAWRDYIRKDIISSNDINANKAKVT